MKKYTQDDIIKKLNKLVFNNHRNKQANFADYLGVSNSYVSSVLTGKKEPSEEMLSLIGFKKEKQVFYVRLK